MSKYVTHISKPTKEEYIKAIQDSCDYIKNNLSEKMLDDMNENKIKSIKFTINVCAGEISVVNVRKEYIVEGEED